MDFDKKIYRNVVRIKMTEQHWNELDVLWKTFCKKLKAWDGKDAKYLKALFPEWKLCWDGICGIKKEIARMQQEIDKDEQK